MIKIPENMTMKEICNISTNLVFTYKNGKTWMPSSYLFETMNDAKVVAVNFGRNRYGSTLKKIGYVNRY